MTQTARSSHSAIRAHWPMRSSVICATRACAVRPVCVRALASRPSSRAVRPRSGSSTCLAIRHRRPHMPRLRRAEVGPCTQCGGRSGASTRVAAAVCSDATMAIRVLTRVRSGVAAAVVMAALVVATLAPVCAGIGADYKIRVGDTLTISIYNEPTLTQPAVRVLPGGAVAMPLAGEVRVAGLTSGQASNVVAKALSRFLKNPSVTVAVALLGPVEVLVLGNVKTPGKYVMQPESRLTDALAAAGGLGPTDGDLPTARLQTLDGAVSQVSLQKLLHDGDTSLNAPISNEMTVHIPSLLTLYVQIFGAVDH